MTRWRLGWQADQWRLAVKLNAVAYGATGLADRTPHAQPWRSAADDLDSPDDLLEMDCPGGGPGRDFATAGPMAFQEKN